MPPTLEDVFSSTRAVIGEHVEDEPQPVSFTDTLLRPHVQTALRKLWSSLSTRGLDPPERETFYLLPQYQSRWEPSLSGADRFGGLLEVRSATVDETATVSTLDTSTGVVTFDASHGYEVGDKLYIYGVVGPRQGKFNGRHTVTAVPGATQVTLGGVVDSGTYASGGTAVKATGQFSDRLHKVDSLDSPVAGRDRFAWQDGVLYVPADTGQQRLLLIKYLLSKELPLDSAAEIGVEGSEEFLAHYAAAIALRASGARGEYQDLLQLAADFLDSVIRLAVQDDQAVVRQVQRWRPRRLHRRRVFRSF